MKIQTFSLLMLCLLLVCSAGTVPSARAEEYRVGTWKTPQTIQPFFYARYLKAGSRISVFPFTNPADQKTALLAGSLDMCGTTITHAIHSASRGEPVVIVAALCNKCSALVVQRRGDIQAVTDLRERKIGYVPGTMHEVLLRETLARGGLSPEGDVHLVRVDFFDMGLALAHGNIDAFLSGEPFPTRAVVEGYGRILSYPYFGETIGTINAGMLVLRDMLTGHPHRVEELVSAHVEATEYLTSHPAAWLDRASHFGTPREILERAAPNMELAWQMDDDFVRKAAALGRRMKALGMIDREPDYETLIDLSFVRQIREARQDRQ